MRSLGLLILLLFCYFEKAESAKEVNNNTLDKNGLSVIAFVTTPVLVIVLAMSIFGKRLKYTGVRWFTINLCIWGLLHMVYITGYREKCPFPDWFACDVCIEEKWTLESLGKSAFPFGIGFLLLERIILTLVPKLEDHRIFNLCFAIIFLFVQNIVFAGIFAWQRDYTACYQLVQAGTLNEDACFWYDPAELLHMYSYGFYLATSTLYLIFCFAGWMLFCVRMWHYAARMEKKSPRIFVQMWMTWLYATVPHFIHGTLFASAVAHMIMVKFLLVILQSPIFAPFFGGPAPTTQPPPTQPPVTHLPSNVTQLPPTPALPTEPPPKPLLTMDNIMFIISLFTEAVPWFVALFPLIEVSMVLLCFQCYREQLFAMISCGQFYSERAKTYEQKETTSMPPRLSLMPACSTPDAHPILDMFLLPNIGIETAPAESEISITSEHLKKPIVSPLVTPEQTSLEEIDEEHVLPGYLITLPASAEHSEAKFTPIEMRTPQQTARIDEIPMRTQTPEQRRITVSPSRHGSGRKENIVTPLPLEEDSK